MPGQRLLNPGDHVAVALQQGQGLSPVGRFAHVSVLLLLGVMETNHTIALDRHHLPGVGALLRSLFIFSHDPILESIQSARLSVRIQSRVRIRLPAPCCAPDSSLIQCN